MVFKNNFVIHINYKHDRFFLKKVIYKRNKKKKYFCLRFYTNIFNTLDVWINQGT